MQMPDEDSLLGKLVRALTHAQDVAFVKDDFDPADATFVCIRVTEEPAVPSVRRICANCGSPVWVDETRAIVADQMTISCLECVRAELKNVDKSQIPLDADAFRESLLGNE